VVSRIVFRTEVFKSKRSHRGCLRDVVAGQPERDKPRQGAVASTLRSHPNGTVGFIGWLDCRIARDESPESYTTTRAAPHLWLGRSATVLYQARLSIFIRSTP